MGKYIKAKYLYYFTHILLILLMAAKCFSSIYYREELSAKLLPVLFIFSVINILFIILSKYDKSKYFKNICYEILEIIILNIILSLICSVIIWIRRDIRLIEIANITEYNSLYVFVHVFFNMLIISYIIILLVNIKKSFKIDRNIFFLLFPAKMLILFILYFIVWFAWDTVCPWDPLIDTSYSNNFNIYNIDKMYLGMTKENALEIMGEPLFERTNEEGNLILDFTSDGKYYKSMATNVYGDFPWYSIAGGYAYFYYSLEFDNGILVKIESFWAYD